MKTIPINKPLIDSLTLRIELNKVNVIDPRLTSETQIYYTDLNEVSAEPLPPKPISYVVNGITFRFSLSNLPVWNKELSQHIQTTFIEVVLSTKLLRSNYFDGINKNNIKQVYEVFQDCNIFKCDFETFINGQVNDVDICKNYYVSKPTIFLELLNIIYNLSDNKKKHLHIIEKPTSIGLTCNKRPYATPSLPFVKYYFKEWELLNRSVEFYNIYIKDTYGSNINNLCRVECTIKNYKHKVRLQDKKVLPMFKTLKELLEIEEKPLNDFVKFSCNSYVYKFPKLKAPNLSPTEHLIFELLQLSIMKGCDFEQCLDLVNSFVGTSPDSTKVAKSRMRSTLKRLFKILESKSKVFRQKAYNNAEINKTLASWGVSAFPT